MSFTFHGKEIEAFPLLSALPLGSVRCPKCMDTGLWLSPTNEMKACSRGCQFNKNTASTLLADALICRTAQELWIDPQAFDVARILTHYTSENPIKRERLQKVFFEEHPEASPNDGMRKIMRLIEILRSDWLLPVGSRKHEPQGHWIITDVEDCKRWLKDVTSAPVTQLATVWRVARHNFPKLAGQEEFDFKNEIENRILEMETAR